MSPAPWPLPALVPLVAGLAWLLGPADEGVVSFLLSIGPGALLLAGAVGAFLMPQDLRTNQVTALGGALGTAVGVLALAFAGVFAGLGLIALSAASFVAAGWLAHADEPDYDDVPPSPLTLGLAAKVAIDEATLGSMALRARPPSRAERHASVEEVERAASLFRERGWIEKPESYHDMPPPLERPALAPGRARGVDYEHLSFESGYEPPDDVPGRERWLGYAKNRTAHAWVLRHPGAPRPWLVCIHGYGMGTPRVDLGAFRPDFLHERLGLNLLVPVLPLHGPRQIRKRSGEEFLGGYELNTVHAEAQAMWDLRRLLHWVRAQDAPGVGTYGLSLGGYTASLLASLDADLACVIAGIPATDFARIGQRFATPMFLREADAIGLAWEDVEAVFRVISPLALAPQVPHERRSIFAGNADRLVPPDQPRDLWLHWECPRIEWYVGSHLSVGWEAKARATLREELEAHLVAR